MQLDNFLNKKIIVTQVKGGSKLDDRQKGSLIGLGLRGIGSNANLTCSSAVLGMIKKVQHIIKVSLV
ncbi:MAG: uL30 family ribosomal protein [Rickettsiales bacterium]|nr:uL30 family ribosomal protein [Rickettsiales bacterium]